MKNSIEKEMIQRLKKAHEEHYNTLETVEDVIYKSGFCYTKCYRGRRIDFSKYDLIISVGGDGTFLESARQITSQTIIGVNSSKNYSVGNLCIANKDSFKKIFNNVTRDNFKIGLLQRLHLSLDGFSQGFDVLNDILISHQNPAAMSRYIIKIKDTQEEQRSSGVWIASSSGSSGAIHSAGGNLLTKMEKKFQYLPRELYLSRKKIYRLKGGTLNPRQVISITSLMRKGMIFIDGPHLKLPFVHGAHLKVSLSPNPVRIVMK